MRYLTPTVRPEWLGRPDVGLLLTPNMGNVPDLTDQCWAADNGCFTTRVRFDLARYLRWLARWPAAARARCLFATAPDVVGDAAATWARSAPVLPALRTLGYPAALVAQDGIAPERLAWDAFDVLFVGGTTAFKLADATYALAAEARARGKWTHLGRVNSGPRFHAARAAGYDSADGSLLCFGPTTNRPRLEAWLARAAVQPVLL